jgi:hypothetical protein
MIAQILRAVGLGLSEEEREERAQRKAEAAARRAMFKEQQKEIKYFAAKLPEWLAKMGYAYWYRKNEKDLISGQYNGVKIAEAHIGEDAYYLRVDTKRLPRGVMLWMLRDDKTLETLSAAAFSEVEWHQNETGCWAILKCSICCPTTLRRWPSPWGWAPTSAPTWAIWRQ